ncbi:MAG: hypothetical protein WC974_05260 [Thermoplasmata archaeon]
MVLVVTYLSYNGIKRDGGKQVKEYVLKSNASLYEKNDRLRIFTTLKKMLTDLGVKVSQNINFNQWNYAIVMSYKCDDDYFIEIGHSSQQGFFDKKNRIFVLIGPLNENNKQKIETLKQKIDELFISGSY